MKRFGVRLLVVFVIGMLGSAARAQERWVDAANGNDTAGDGSVTRPWRTITRALTVLNPPSASAPANVHINPGTYDSALGEVFPLHMNPFVNLLGADPATTIIRVPGSAAGLVGPFSFASPFRLRIDRLTITRDVVPQLPEVGIALNGYSNTPLEVEISRCVIERHGYGVYLRFAIGSPWIHDCVIRDMVGDGIEIFGAGSPRIERNRFERNGGSGVVVGADDVTSTPLIANNTLVANRTGVYLLSGGFTGSNNYQPPVFRGGTLDASLDANRVLDGERGIYLSCTGIGQLRSLVTNTVTAGNQRGIEVDAPSTYSTRAPASIQAIVAGSTISQNTVVGVRQGRFANVRIVDSIVVADGTDLDGVASGNVAFSDIGTGGFPSGNGNLSVDPQFVDAANRDFRLRATSPCIDAGTLAPPAPPQLPGVDIDGLPRDFDGNRDGTRAVDMGAHEFAPIDLACRYGNVDARLGPVADVLTVNGSIGDVDRVVSISAGTAVRIDVGAPPGGPSPAAFVLFVFPGVPDPTTPTRQPHGLGTACFPTPLNGAGSSRALVIFNNIARPQAQSIFGSGRLPSTAAPFSATFGASNTRSGVVATLQGFIADAASTNGSYAITNAVVVRVP
ncbi:MAG: DUF1565 domain-containing protein [Planctomycetes bacterium]|nr:DUF1565 domain-containing protein [Planctomycetota bacterium]MBI3844297.1 DUF1565 domain-containing protein [Planctomycetota bacterium]